MADEYPFNDELLITPEDRATARAEFPLVYPALDFPALRDEVLAIDRTARAAKTRTRRFGMISVALVSISLFIASGIQLVHGWPDLEHGLAVASAVLGLVGSALVVWGLSAYASKRAWLRGRFQVERTRQFHFQLLVRLSQMITRAAETGAWEDYLARRAALYGSFRQAVLERADSEHLALMDEDPDFWLVDEVAPTAGGKLHPQLASAYRRLRIDRQIAFCNHKLQRGGGLFSVNPRDQAGALGVLSLLCVAATVIIHIAIASSLAFLEGLKPYELLLHVAAVWFALLALLLRAIAEGLQPGHDAERYAGYRRNLTRLRAEFDFLGPDNHLRAMAHVEELSVEEMLDFMRTMKEARFVL